MASNLAGTWRALLPVLALGGFGAVASASPPIRTVVIEGHAAPGTADGVEFAGFVRLGINARGQVVFEADIRGPGVEPSNDRGVWVGQPGELQLVVREGGDIPGEARRTRGPREEFSLNRAGEIVLPDERVGRNAPHFGLRTLPSVLLVMNGEGQIAFSGTVREASSDRRRSSGIWCGSPGRMETLARTGQPAAGVPGVQFAELLSSPSVLLLLNDAGEVAFHGKVSGAGIDTGNAQGLWAGSPERLTLVARAGSPAPDVEGNVRFDRYPVSGFVLNNVGRIAFLGRLDDDSPEITGSNDRGIWMGLPGAVRLVAREGSPAPGTNELFLTLSSPVINNAGQIAFWAEAVGAGVGGQKSAGIWVGTPERLSAVARSGEPAPGLSSDVHFSTRLDEPVINRSGIVAFACDLTGPGVENGNDHSIWAGTPDDLLLVAREGDRPPGTGGDERFESFGPSLLLNGAGQIAFRAELDGPEVFEWNDRGIWAGPPDDLVLVIREGDQIEVARGDIRTVEHLALSGISGGEDGRHTSFNDQGKLVFSVLFRDATRGVFIAEISQGR